MIDIELNNSCPISSAMQILEGSGKSLFCQGLEMVNFVLVNFRLWFLWSLERYWEIDQLKEMERDGLVLRQQFIEIPPKVEYSLTEGAIQLKKILQDLRDW